MKFINSSFFRAIIAFIAGGLMVQYREQMVEWFTKSIGVIFFVSGIISVVIYYVGKTEYGRESIANQADKELKNVEYIVDKPAFPMVGLGSIILGVILFFMSTSFITSLVYIFAAVIILGAVGEYASLISMGNTIRDFKLQTKGNVNGESSPTIPHCGVRYWIIPTLLLLFGIFTIIKPMVLASAPFLFIGIAMIIYGLSELIFGIKFYAVRRYIARQLAVSADITSAIVEENNATIVETDAAEEAKPCDTVEKPLE